MNIVLMEELGVAPEVIEGYAEALRAAGHDFKAYSKSTDPAVQTERAKDADVLIIANTPLSGEVIRACPNLKYIDVAFTGVDHVDLDACRENGVRVSNAAGYSTQAVAELAIAMMLSLLRNVEKTEAALRAGGTKDGLVGSQLSSKTVGIVGLGAIGTRVAELAHAFGADVIATKRRITGNEPDFVTMTDLNTLLENADILSLHCPATPQTQNLISGEEIARTKDGAILINTARGPVLDTQAAVAALRSGKLAAAGIDVFDTEPPLAQDHPFFSAPNTLLTPHIAFASDEAMAARADIVFDNLKSYLGGEQKNVIL